MGNNLPAAVGEAVIGTVLIILGAFAPLILFRLLAFVDPGTSSGQAFRASLDAAGGLTGLLSGGGKSASSGEGGGSGAATATSSDGGGSQGEAAATAATQSRLATAMGPAGAGLSGVSRAGQAVTAFSMDTLSAAGIGHQSPYFASPTGSPAGPSNPSGKPSGDPANTTGSDGQQTHGTEAEGGGGDTAPPPGPPPGPPPSDGGGPGGDGPPPGPPPGPSSPGRPDFSRSGGTGRGPTGGAAGAAGGAGAGLEGAGAAAL